MNSTLPTSNAVVLEIHTYHDDCPKQDEWRAKGQSGWPRFIVMLQQRYNPGKTYAKCEACDTTISTHVVHSTEVESS